MKILKYILAISLCLSIGLFSVQAQQYKAEVKGAKKVSITQLYGKINIKETTGTQLIIDVKNLEEVVIPKKAEGLKPLSAFGEDNTNIGLNVENSGSVIQIAGVSKQSSEGIYHIKIPKGIAVVIEYNSPFTYDDIDVDGFSSELEVSTMNDDINLKNVTGPLVLNTINGDVNIDFSTVNQNSPISITAINGEIDMHIPAATPANLNISTMQGEVYTNFDIAFEQKEKDGLSFIGGGQEIEGTINNGGVAISIKSINDNIYLRKK